jgi:3-hydroxy acid dehydrogenase/malonic semialdehyde reductase
MAKTALITGASSGIGRGAAVRLAAEGWHILAHGRNPDTLDETLAAIEQAGGTGESFQAEMAEMEDVAKLANWATSRDRLDAMIHCAACCEIHVRPCFQRSF